MACLVLSLSFQFWSGLSCIWYVLCCGVARCVVFDLTCFCFVLFCADLSPCTGEETGGTIEAGGCQNSKRTFASQTD